MTDLAEHRRQFQRRWYDLGIYSSTTLADYINRNAERFPDAYIAFESGAHPDRLTYSQALAQSREIAAAMHSLGIDQGDRVAIQLPSWSEAMLVSQACILLGAVIVPVTGILGESEVEFIVNDAGARLLFIPGQWRNRDYRDMVGQLLANTGVEHVVVVDSQAPEGALAWSEFVLRAGNAFPPATSGADDVVMQIYTSGTTAKPKGVLHSHNSLASEVKSAKAYLGDRLDLSILNPWPFGHIASFMPFVRFWMEGVNCVVTDKWDAEYVARLVAEHQIGSTSGVPYFLSSMVEAADAQNIDISCMSNYATGATNVPPELIRLCNERGMFCYRMYGSTEHPTVTSGYAGDPLEKCISTDGRCMPGCDVRIVDEMGEALPQGEEGEVAIIGPDQFLGYSDPDRNQSAFTADGWFLTGDIGRVDIDGYLTITDRKKDIIIRGGENISSREVEECVLSHPSVAAAAAIAMPDLRLGEKVCIYVECKPGTSLTLDDVVNHFSLRKIARQKTPEFLRHIEEMPRTATGKINKQILRRLLKTEWDDKSG